MEFLHSQGFQEPNNLDLPRPFGDVEQRKSDRQLKTTGPGTARVQEEDHAIVALLGLMGVAADDRVESGSLWIDVEIVEIVEHIEIETGNFDNRGKRQLLRPRLCVHVAAHGKHGSDSFQLGEYFRCTHVSRVNDQLDSGEGALRFRSEKAVAIGNEANPPGDRESY